MGLNCVAQIVLDMLASVSFNLGAMYTIVLLKTIMVNSFVMELIGLVVVMEISQTLS